MGYVDLEKPENMTVTEALRNMPVGKMLTYNIERRDYIYSLCSYFKKKEGIEFSTGLDWIHNEIRVWRIK